MTNPYPLAVRVCEGSHISERQAYGRYVEDGIVKQILISEPVPGKKSHRYLMVNWCEKHLVGWKGASCPFCQMENEEPGTRLRRILAGAPGTEFENAQGDTK